MKKLILVLDGLIDRKVDGLTPLMKANTPFLDELSRCGEIFRVKTIPDGLEMASEYGNMTLMGLSPKLDFPGRSAVELLGLGHPLNSDEYTYRMNLVSYEANSKILANVNAHGVTDDEHNELFKVLKEIGLKFDLELFGVGGHAFLLKGKTRFASLERPDKKLGYDVDYLYRGDKLCETIHQQIEKALKSHPVNMSRLLKGKPMIHSAWIWGRGQLVKKDAIKHKMDVAVVTGTPLVKGLAKLKGYTIINADGVTGSLVTNYKNKIRASLEALNQFDVVYCHVKSPDLASHLKDVDLKMKVIETIDKEMIASIYESLKDCLHPTEVYVLSDLGTCSHSGEHFADVVPCLHAIAPWQRGYNTENFDENAGKSSVILDDKQWIKRFL